MAIETINPATGEVIKRYTEMPDFEVRKIIDSTHQAFLKWKTFDFKKRGSYFHTLAHVLRKEKKEYATLMASEMGKPLSQAESEIEKCAITCEHYANQAAAYLESKIIKTNMSKTYVSYQPLGVIFAIMPWNFPFWQVFRFAIPTLMAGNGALLKHAPISTGTALIIEKLFLEAGFLENLFRTLVISESMAGEVIANPKVMAVTLTGSTKAGKIVGEKAASALKPCVLELGGSDPYLILEDADLEMAATACVTSRMNNAGQSCIAAKRIIVMESAQEAFLKLVEEKLKKYKMGNPLSSETTCGPLARLDLRDKVHHQVEDCINKGGKLITGGYIPPEKGFYYPPTLITHIKKGMAAYNEEIFGPVIAVITARDEEEAISIANDTNYGLGAAIFTKDVSHAEKIAVEEIQAGTCAINTWVASDPRSPFGGIKQSGHGRELSVEGIHSFVNVKTINIL